jgi:hypothetical protein
LDPEFLVPLVGNHLKMLIIHTHALIAHVVNLFLSGDESVLVGEGHNVNCDRLSVKAHPWVATSSASP